MPASGSSSNRRRRRERGSVSLPPQPRSNRRGSTGSGVDEEDDGLEPNMVQPATVRQKSDVGNPAKEGGGGGGGESFLEAFGISSWTPPWSTTKVAVQQPSAKSRPDLGKPADVQPSIPDGVEHASRHRQQQEGKRRGEGVGGSHRDSRRAAVAAAGADAPDARERGKSRGREKGGPDRKSPHLCVLDARTAVAALGNQLVGKGIETGAG